MWAFPFFFISAPFFPGFKLHPGLVFWSVYAPIAGICFYVASKPYRARQITFIQAFLWVCMVPVLIWVCLILGIFGLAFLGHP
jgi:hypothetical protein